MSDYKYSTGEAIHLHDVVADLRRCRSGVVVGFVVGDGKYAGCPMVAFGGSGESETMLPADLALADE